MSESSHRQRNHPESLSHQPESPPPRRSAKVLVALLVLVPAAWFTATQFRRALLDVRLEAELATAFAQIRDALEQRAEELSQSRQPAPPLGTPMTGDETPTPTSSPPYDPHLHELEIFLRGLTLLDLEIALYQRFATGTAPRGSNRLHDLRRLLATTPGALPSPADKRAEDALARVLAGTRPPPFELGERTETLRRRALELAERYLAHAVDPTPEHLDLGPRFDEALRRIHQSPTLGPEAAERIRRLAIDRLESLHGEASADGR